MGRGEQRHQPEPRHVSCVDVAHSLRLARTWRAWAAKSGPRSRREAARVRVRAHGPNRPHPHAPFLRVHGIVARIRPNRSNPPPRLTVMAVARSSHVPPVDPPPSHHVPRAIPRGAWDRCAHSREPAPPTAISHRHGRYPTQPCAACRSAPPSHHLLAPILGVHGIVAPHRATEPDPGAPLTISGFNAMLARTHRALSAPPSWPSAPPPASKEVFAANERK